MAKYRYCVYGSEIRFVLFLLGFSAISAAVLAQRFQFNYTGPDTLYLNADCEVVLDWGHPENPTFTPLIQGLFIQSQTITISGGHSMGALLTKPEVLTITYRVLDNQGVFSTFSFVISVVDTIPPLIDLTDTAIVTCAVFPSITSSHFSDNCTSFDDLTIEFSDDVTPDFCLGNTVKRTYTVADASGNTSIFEQVLIIEGDSQSPQITTNPEDLIHLCEGQFIEVALQEWISSNGSAAAQDNCTNLTWTTIPAIPDILAACQDPQEVWFVVSDACGNSDSSSAIFQVSDQEAPILINNAVRVIHFCDGSDLLSLYGQWLDDHGQALAQDNCTEAAHLFKEYRVQGEPKSKAELLSAFQASMEEGCEDDLLFGGQMYDRVLAYPIVEFVFADACDNTVSTQATFAAIDTVPPVWVDIPQSMEYACSSQDDIEAALFSWYDNFAGANGEDNCGFVRIVKTPGHADVLNLFLESQSENCGRTGSVEVSFSLVDACGNIAPQTFKASFEVIDTSAPVLQDFPQSITLECSENIEHLIRTHIDQLLGATWIDGCSDVQPILILWNDSNGQQGQSGYQEYGAYPKPDSSDCIWSVELTFVVSDACGNTATASGVLTVEDNTSPTFGVFPPDITVDCNNIPEAQEPVIVDNCRFNLTVNFTETTNQNPDISLCSHYHYNIFRTWEVVDACGNAVSQTQVIQVIDDKGPVFSIPAFTNLSCDADTSVNMQAIRLQVTDNCDPNPALSYQQLILPGNCIGEYRIERRWQAVDACQNLEQFIQQIFVRDTSKPEILQNTSDIIVPCQAENNLAGIFEDWLSQRAGAVVQDNCSPVQSFAAVPGSYSLANRSTWPGTTPVLNGGSCANQDYFIRELVDFVFYDDCGNAAVRQATFTVVDEDPPVFIDCANQRLFPTDPGECSAEISLIAPSVFDLCTGQFATITLSQSKPISSDDPGNIDVIVNPLQFEFNFSLPQGSNAINGQIRLTLNNVDGEGAEEFFRILSENNQFLGRSSSTIVQCGSSNTVISLSNLDINQWLSDGTAIFSLEPNIPVGSPGRFSINDICPGAMATLQLSFSITDNTQIVREWSINDGPRQPLASNQNIQLDLPEGLHTLRHYVRDCFGNEQICVQEIKIEDQELPNIICPSNLSVDLDSDSCTMEVKLPRHLGISDNCGYPDTLTLESPTDSLDALITFGFDPDLQGFIARDLTLTFDQVQNNAESNTVLLTLEILGNVDELGGYFTLFNEDGLSIGTTEIGQAHVIPGDCSTPSIVTFEILAADYNRWAADGKLEFIAVSNTQFTIPPGGPNSGINPCDPAAVNQDGDVDHISYFRGRLDYLSASVSIQISGATVLSKRKILTPDLGPVVSLHAGLNFITYFVQDKSGNEGSCSFQVLVRDLEPPVAKCRNTVIYINPSGLINYQLAPEEIDDGSTDNCSIAQRAVSPNSFTCADVGSEFVVTLSITDEAGLNSACTARVRVESFNLQPRFELDICKPDTLRLFGNVPPGPPGNIYTFRWTGPNGFISFVENPVILSPGAANSGTYLLEVFGSQGCSAIGSVQIAVPEQLGVPDIRFEKNIVCNSETVIMETQLFSGAVTYSWYRGTAPGGVLVGQTSAPSLSINLPPGTYQFYVVVQSSSCTSEPSVSRTVNVLQQVIAEATPDYLELCEGEVLQLGTNQSGSDFTYRWIGPNGFMSDSRNIVVTQSVDFTHAGLYTLFIFDRGCPSTPADVEVVVKAKPAKPVIFYDPVFCPREPITFSVNNIPNADAYRWILPNGSTFTTLQNQFVIGQANTSHNGIWQVVVITGGCESEVSEPIVVEIEELYNFTITKPAPACEKDIIELSVEDIAGATYRWFNADGNLGASSLIRIPSATQVISVEIITENNCRYLVSTQITSIAAPVITGVSSNAEPCMDGTRPICFNATVFPADPGNYIYFWTGPGFSSSEASPCLPNASSLNNGIYRLEVTNTSGCKSESKSLEINIRDVPEKPIIQRELTYCEGGILVLRVRDYGFNAVYEWTTPLGLQTITGNAELSILNIDPSRHSGSYRVRVILNGCSSEFSDLENITVHPNPTSPTIEGLGQLCEGDTLILRVNLTPGATYLWSGPNGLTASGHELRIFPVNLVHTGNYLSQILVNGCPSPQSNPFFVQVNPTPTIPDIESSEAALCGDLPGSNLRLCVAEGQQEMGARYTWFSAETGNPLGPAILSRCFSIDDFSNFRDGLHEFYLQVNLNGCQSPPSIPISVRIDRIPMEFADAGADRIACGISEARLSALPPIRSSGIWTDISGSLVILNPQDPFTMVQNLRPGTNRLVWTLSYRSCLDYERDTVEVIFQTAPVARPDRFVVPFASSALFNVLTNDDFPVAYTLEIVTQPRHGTLSGRPNGGFEFLADPDFVGDDFFEYDLCAIGCPGLCSRGTVILQIGDETICDAPNIITPNGDGINDIFFIPCLSSTLYPQNKVTIFNEYGSVIFEESPYSNRWDGTYKGQDVPVGTYFYIIDFGGSRPVSKGFLVVKR